MRESDQSFSATVKRATSYCTHPSTLVGSMEILDFATKEPGTLHDPHLELDVLPDTSDFSAQQLIIPVLDGTSD